jgi:hypothetical protein
MSKLEEQLKELSLKKKKVDYFKFLSDKLVDIKNIEFKEVESEVKELLTQFISREINLIENGLEDTKKVSKEGDPSIPPIFDAESIKILNHLVEKAKHKFEKPIEQPKESTPQKLPVSDKIRFAQQNRHLEGKTLTAKTLIGEVTGRVVGLDAPNILLQVTPGSPAFAITLEQIIDKK